MRNKYSGCGLEGCFLYIIFYVIIFGCIGALFLPYTVNYWLLYMGKTTHMSILQGFLFGLIPGVGEIIIPAAAITFIISFFM